jgi:cell wall assembly regulator SMI1
LLLTTFAVTRRFARRGSASLKLAHNQWATAPNRTWDGGDVDEGDMDRWLGYFRHDLASGMEVVASDSECAAGIDREAAKPGGAVHLASIHVWRQAPLEKLIERLDQALQRFPEFRASLRPGASEAALRVAEDALGAALPTDVRRLLSYADGQVGGALAAPSFYWRYRWLPLTEAQVTNRIMRDLRDRQFGPEYWSDASLPFLENAMGDHLYVDVSGDYAGRGAVIEFNHEVPATRRVLYGSVTEWLECFVEGIESGLIVFQDGALFPRGFLDTGELGAIRAHDEVRLNGRYPWQMTLRLEDR